MPSKLIFVPIPLLMGGWMFTSSFSSSTIQQSATPYSTQQQIVEVEMPEPAKSFLRFGGGVIAVLGTSSLVFWELADKKQSTKQKFLLAPSQNIESTVPIPNNFQALPSLQNNQEPLAFNQIETRIQQPNDSRKAEKSPPREVTNFYQAGDIDTSISNSYDAVNEFNPHSSSKEKYVEVKSLVYENTVGIVGKEKGSGKTSKLGYLIAEHIKLGHLVWMINPFAKGQQWKGIKVFGRGYKFIEATNAIREFTRIAFWRIAEAGDETKEYEPFEDYHLHLSLDEMSNYSSEIDAIDSTVMPKFWEAVVQFLRQANMSVSFASHGDTQAMLGGAKALTGKSQTIKDAIIWLYAQATTDTNVEGNKRCAGWAYLIRPDGGERQRTRIEIPSWMQGPPATRIDGKDRYNYIQLVQKYCPQYLYLPASTKNTLNMSRKKYIGRDLPQLASSNQLDTNVVDTHYEEFYDGYDDRYSRNNQWHNRAYNAGRYAKGAYNWGQKCSRGVTPAMENGAGAAIGTLGTVANHTNPFKPWRSFAFWSMSIGTLVVGSWVAQFFLGGLIATRNPRQLPQNTSTPVRFGHGVVNSGKPIANGVWNGFGQVATGAGDSLDKAVRLQTVEADNWQQSPVNVKQRKQTTTLPLTTWTGDGQYQPVRRK